MECFGDKTIIEKSELKPSELIFVVASEDFVYSKAYSLVHDKLYKEGAVLKYEIL